MEIIGKPVSGPRLGGVIDSLSRLPTVLPPPPLLLPLLPLPLPLPPPLSMLQRLSELGFVSVSQSVAPKQCTNLFAPTANRPNYCNYRRQ